jgi:hypothetical protein
MRSIHSNFSIYKLFLLRKFRSLPICKSDRYFYDFANKTIIAKTAENCHVSATNIMTFRINRALKIVKAADQILCRAIGNFKVYAPKVIESLLKIPIRDYAQFLSETYSSINFSEENDFINKTQSKGYKCFFVLKYCSYSLLSFYI